MTGALTDGAAAEGRFVEGRFVEVLGLGTPGEGVYLAMLANPSWGVAELVAHLRLSEQQVRDALDELFDRSLLRQSVEDPARFRVVSPQVALGAWLADKQAELARRQQDVAESQASILAILAEYSAQPAGRSYPDAERLVGLDAVYDRLEQLTGSARAEVLSLLPGGAQSAAALHAGRRNDARLLGRGVSVRTLLQDSARNDQLTSAYARWLTDKGGQVRTAPVLPPRMRVVDGRIALVPLDPEDSRAGALQVTGPGLIASLVVLFEAVWSVATTLGSAEQPDAAGLTHQERVLLKLLAQGLTDEAAAKRLGVSERTTRRMMAGLMERLGARSRFEAGLRAAERGWL